MTPAGSGWAALVPVERSGAARSRRLVAPAIGGWGAAAGGTLLEPRLSVTIAALASVVCLVSTRGSAGWWVVIRGLALGAALGATAAAWHVHTVRSGPVPRLAAQRAEVEVLATLVRDPTAVTTSTGMRLTVTDATVRSVYAHGWRPAHSPVLVLSSTSGWVGLLPGQRVEAAGRLAPPRRGDDVAAVLDARGPPSPIGRPPWWQRAAGRVRLALRLACHRLPADERGLLPGLVDGDVSAVPATMHDDLRVTGLTHLEAVSGENVAVVLAVTITIARSIGVRRRTRAVVSAFSLLGFVVLARPSPSVLRAAVMGGLTVLALLRGRRIPALPALSAAVLGLVCVDPFLARSVGFVLSVVATAALLTVAPRWTERLSRHLPAPVAAAIAVPAAAQLACTPVLLLAFGQLTPYAVPANLLAAPAVAPATVLGVTCAVVATAWLPLAAPIAWLAALPTAGIGGVARVMAAMPGAGVSWPGGWRWDLGAAAIGAVVALRGLRRHRRGHAILGRWPP